MTALREALEHTALGWIKPELDETLRLAKAELEDYVEDPADVGRMRLCAGYLHQVQGTLRMVELYAPAMVAEEMEQVALGLHGGTVADRDGACAALLRGIVLLPDYLERLQGGHRDIPIVLLPLLNELRAARGESLLSESVLFSPDLERPLPGAIAAAGAASNDDMPPLLEALRREIGQWQEHTPATALSSLAPALEGLLGHVRQVPVQRMLWVATGVARAVADGALPASPALRKVFAGVEREARRALLDNDGYAEASGEGAQEPTRQLLYHVAHQPDDGHPALRELRQVFELEAALPTQSELEHAQGSISGRNRALLDTVSAAVKDDLLHVKDALDLHLRTGSDDLAALQPHAETLGRVADTLGMLGLGAARKVVQQQRDGLQAILDGAVAANEDALLDVAGALLYVDATLDDQVARLGAAEPAGAGGEPFAGEARQVVDTIVREAIANFVQARQALVAFVETSWQHEQLSDVPRLLDEVAGALRMMELAQPADYLVAVSRYTQNELIARQRVPNGRQLDTLADALASLEYYLEALREQRGNRDEILDIARGSLEALGYWPLPEPVAPPAAQPEPGHDEETAAASTDVSAALAEPVEAAAVAEPVALPVSTPVEIEVAAPVRTADLPVGPVAGGFETVGEEIDEEIREVFLEEFAEEIDNLDALLPQWRSVPEDMERLRPIRRVFHTLKGSGRLVGARALGEFSWKIENMLNRVLDRSRPPSPAVIAMVDRAFYTLPELQAALRGERGVSTDLEALQDAADRIASGDETMPPEAAPAVVHAPLVDEMAQPAPDAVEPQPEPEPEPEPEPQPERVPASIDALLLEILDAEVQGHLQTVDAWVAQARVGDSHGSDALLRALHTMNGAFAMTEVPVINSVLGPAEHYARRLLASQAMAAPEGIDAVAELSVAVRETVEILKGPAPALAPQDALAARLVALRDSLPEAASGLASLVDAQGLEEAAGAEAPALTTDDLSAYLDLADDIAIERTVESAVQDDAPGGEVSGASGTDLPADALQDGAQTVDAGIPETGGLGIAATAGVDAGVPVEGLEVANLDSVRLEAERLEAERLEAGRLEAERLEAERVEAERVEAERLEAERLEAEQHEAEAVEPEPEVEVADADAAVAHDEAPVAESAAEPAAELQPSAPAGVDAAVAALLARVLASDDPDEPFDTSRLDIELLDIFLEESGDLLDHADTALTQLRESPDSREPLIALQRDLHTLKGGARMAGVFTIGELGHAMESMLEAVVEQRCELDRTGIGLLEGGFDRLHAMVTRVAERRAIDMPQALIDAFNALARGRPLLAAEATPEPAAAQKPELAPLSTPINDLGADDDTAIRAPQEQVRIRADLLDRLVNYAGEVAIYRARLEQQLGAFRSAMNEMEQTNTRLRDQLRRLEIETEAQIIARYQREGDAGDASFDPLELDRFSTLQQLSRALGESAADMTSLQQTLDDLTRQYETLLLQQSRVSSDLQEGLMRTRMVPFDALVPRLRRVLRQAASDTGKQVQLKLDGSQGELDRNVLERMTAPLEHMLRNAVAHGIESPERRREAGKGEEGTVRIAVRREGSEVVLEIGDDGSGLDRGAIRRRAEERGLVRTDAVLSDGDLDALIFEPGFSTADEVSRLAGRGVGMDVVASEVRQLGGSLDISTRRGQGTSFTLRLPQTLAVTQAVFVRIGETQFAVPIASVRGVGRIERDRLASGDASYSYGGEEYALHDLGLLVGHAPARADGHLQMPLLLVRSGELRAAVAVDEIIGSREIVVKPVGPQVASIPGIFGATIMGDGSVVVILDVAPLARRHAVLPRDTAPEPQAERRRVPLVMVVDDSVTMRKVTGRVLERHNLEVLTAKDGIDALERMEERVPDLMLLDIEMPRMDGYELARQMKADPRLRDVLIMMITSRTGEKHRQRAFDLGVDRYLGKPYQEPELMRNVHELLKVSHGRE